MSKSALIVDTPDNCLRCRFCIKDFEYPTCQLHKLIGGSYNITWEELDKIPKWCPLVEIPNRMEDCHGYNKGWNDVLDIVLKDGE